MEAAEAIEDGGVPGGVPAAPRGAAGLCGPEANMFFPKRVVRELVGSVCGLWVWGEGGFVPTSWEVRFVP